MHLKKKALFTHSYFLQLDPKQWKAGQPYAPLGTLYAAAYARDNTYDVAVYDTMFSSSPQEITTAIEKSQPDFFVIYDDGFNYLTKMCLSNMREAAFEMISIAKQHGCVVVISSSDSTDRYEMYLEKGADFIMLGEAELTLVELLNNLSADNNTYELIPGIAYKKNDAVVKTAKRNILRDLDSLPFPAWDLIDINPYKNLWQKSSGYFSINMGTTRGCPFKCNWCAKPIYGNRYNSRSPEKVVEELIVLKQKYAFGHVWFCDDIFGLKPGWVHRFADLVQEKNLRFRFKIQARADLLLQEDYVADLARAGCEEIWMGAESGSQKVLDAMDKGTTIDQIRESTRLIKKFGMEPCFFIQFGYPGETKEDIHKTIKMINTLLPAYIGISVSYPLPGTKFYENVKNDLKLKTNWTDSDELALMFTNTYSPAFYKQLYNYVHKNYQMHISKASLKEIFIKPIKTDLAKLKRALAVAYYLPLTIIEKRKLSKIEKEF